MTNSDVMLNDNACNTTVWCGDSTRPDLLNPVGMPGNILDIAQLLWDIRNQTTIQQCLEQIAWDTRTVPQNFTEFVNTVQEWLNASKNENDFITKFSDYMCPAEFSVSPWILLPLGVIATLGIGCYSIQKYEENTAKKNSEPVDQEAGKTETNAFVANTVVSATSALNSLEGEKSPLLNHAARLEEGRSSNKPEKFASNAERVKATKGWSCNIV